MNSFVLGTGRLTWLSSERRSDRYGFVYLIPYGNSLSSENIPAVPLYFPIELLATRGRLIAEVVEARESTHIGDLFHGVFPETPGVGERIVLGEGAFVVENSPHVQGPMVGTLPDDKRATLRMDIHALYRAHEQTVRLVFEPKEAA